MPVYIIAHINQNQSFICLITFNSNPQNFVQQAFQLMCSTNLWWWWHQLKLSIDVFEFKHSEDCDYLI